MNDADKFRTVTSDSGYVYDAEQRGSHGSAILHGAECPQCLHVFMPTIGDRITCPNCDFVELLSVHGGE